MSDGICCTPECDRLVAIAKWRLCQRCYHRAWSRGLIPKREPRTPDEQVVALTVCPICATPVENVVGRRGRARIYCSTRCRRASRSRRVSRERQFTRQDSAKPCEICQEAFPVSTRGPVSRFCSKTCREIGAGQRLAAPYLNQVCALAECDSVFTPKHKNQACCCEAHGKIHCRAKAKAEGRKWKKNGNPEVRRANLRRKTQQRRARTKGDANAELIERSEIGDRDGWRCGICSRHVDQSLEYPHPRSPSLDHIHPLSLGGTHVRANVQIAHLECNVHKSNRVADVQPLLVG